MNKMMSLFPGTNNSPPFTHQDLKNIYFKMMPIEWQHAFIHNGQDIASDNYSLLKLQQYMTTQETFHHSLTQSQHSQQNQSHNQNKQEHLQNHSHHHYDDTHQGPPCQCF